MRAVLGHAWSTTACGKAALRIQTQATALVDFALTITCVACGVGALYGIVVLADWGIINRRLLIGALSVLCPFVNCTQYISPAPVVLECLRKRDVSNLPSQVFLSQAACNILALAYAIRMQNYVVLASNSFGLACQILYLASDHYVRHSNGRWLMFSLKFSTAFNVGLYICAAVIPMTALGQTTTLLTVVLFASPLSKIGIILRTGNASSLPKVMTTMATLNNAFWTLYGMLIADVFLLVPSILGFMLSWFQVLVLLWAAGKLPFDLSYLLLLCRSKTGSSPKADALQEMEDLGTMEEWGLSDSDSP